MLLLFTQAPIIVWFDGTIIDIINSSILLTMYYYITVVMLCYDWWLCMVINISERDSRDLEPPTHL